MSKDIHERDELDHLFELSSRTDPAPGPAFKNTLAELRRQQRPAPRQGWRGLVLAGLGVAALMAIGLVAAVLLLVNNTGRNQNTSVVAGLPIVITVATVTLAPATATSVAPTVTPPAAVVTVTASAPTVARDTPALTQGAISTNPTQGAKLVNTPEEKTQATQTGSATPQTSPATAKIIAATPIALETPITIEVSPGTGKPGGNVAPPTSVAGTVTSYDQNAGLLQLTARNGKVSTVKLLPATVVYRKSQPAKAADIAVGGVLTAEGQPNAQGQFEATSIILDIQYVAPVIGDPGFPNEKQ